MVKETWRYKWKSNLFSHSASVVLSLSLSLCHRFLFMKLVALNTKLFNPN